MHSDEQLIKKIKRRSDREAAGELLQRYYRDIYAFIFRQVSHRETAMDLTQDTFIAVLRGLPSFYSLVLLRSLVHGRKSGDEFSRGRGSGVSVQILLAGAVSSAGYLQYRRRDII